jgi:threonine/homoserine/homoserine lactone efflux protein
MMGIWSLKRGTLAGVLCALGTFMAIAQWMILTMNGSIGLEVNMAIALVLAAVSVTTISLAYRRWCRADLD